ncbi:MAG TPA: NAD(P)/FAD-dependent oxidoreductase [Caulobacteraceae bacterium]
MSDILDAVIIGAGPGGLSGAIYLARFQRRFLVIDSGESRLDWIPCTHNHPGFPDGVEGPVLRGRIREQAERYGARIRPGRVVRLAGGDWNFELALEDGETLRARKVLLATGVIDNEPAIEGFREAVRHTQIRICPICDAYEARGKAIGIVGNSAKGAREALFLRGYSDKVTLIHVGAAETLPDRERREIAEAGVELIVTPIEGLLIGEDEIAALDFGSGGVRRFDTLYSALGTTPRGQLAEQIGALTDPGGCLQVNDHQETAVPGLYAAGDLVRGLNQISVAQGEAAIAATDIHNKLRQAGLAQQAP